MPLTNFVICVRNVEPDNETFGSEPGETRYLEIPDGEPPHPVNHRLDREVWVNAVLNRANADQYRHPKEAKSPVIEFTMGDILVFVHGYNNSTDVVMKRHNLLQKRLAIEKFNGAIVSFDWPSAEYALNYLEDRSDAQATAHLLVEDGIKVLATLQREQHERRCDIDVHLLGHSTGAYVIREAFYKASQSRLLSRIQWNVSQVALIGADIAQSSLSKIDSKSQALFKHSIRITNYQNPYDSVLKLSNIKRLGLKPRAGRVGIPEDAPDSVVNVNTGEYWKTLKDNPDSVDGNWAHSWYFNDSLFAKDLAMTLAGDIDRNAFPDRKRYDNSLWLVRP